MADSTITAPPRNPAAQGSRTYKDLSNHGQDLKSAVHRELISRLDLEKLMRTPDGLARQQLLAVIHQLLGQPGIPLSAIERDVLAREVLDEVFGLGPLEPLLQDPTISDILVNTYSTVYVERHGVLEETPVVFKDNVHLMHIVEKIVSGVGRRVDESSPMVDARLPDGSRVNVAIRPIAIDGPLMSIRKFAQRAFTMDRLVEVGALRPAMVEILAAAVSGKVSAIISGGTGSGKTTMLNGLSNFIPQHERLITIEDAAELQLQQPHVGRLETRPANIEGKGEIRQRDLVRNALRMRPDRIIIGECRGEEAFDMLQAMNTGHEGSMTTIHANSPREALKRLEQMVGMAGMPMTLAAIRSQIASALTLVVQVQRFPDGGRRVTSISEVTGMEGDVIQMHEIFRFVKSFTDKDGKLHGAFKATGVRPQFLANLKAYGLEVPAHYFDV